MSGKITPEDIVEFERLNERLGPDGPAMNGRDKHAEMAAEIIAFDKANGRALDRPLIWGAALSTGPLTRDQRMRRAALAEREAQLPAVITSGRER